MFLLENNTLYIHSIVTTQAVNGPSYQTPGYCGELVTGYQSYTA